MENEKNELMIFDKEKASIYTSLNCESVEDKKSLYNALENCDVLLNDVVNTEILMKDIYIQEMTKTVKDEKTGEVKFNEKTGEVLTIKKYRTIIFDVDGKTYATGAYGVVNSLKRIISVFGEPATWESPIKVKVVKKPIKDGKQSLSLILV